MQGLIKYSFTSSMWQDSSSGGWYFISLPKDISKEIRENLKWQEEGWGRMKVMACIHGITWDTAIWYDTKANTYLLPVKADIRKKGDLKVNEYMDVILWV